LKSGILFGFFSGINFSFEHIQDPATAPAPFARSPARQIYICCLITNCSPSGSAVPKTYVTLRPQWDIPAKRTERSSNVRLIN
jgi:hypothetical protein